MEVESAISLPLELCGKLVERYGRKITIAIPSIGCTGSDLLARVSVQYPALAPILVSGRIRICVNEGLVPDDAHITSSDNVALFPPVSGG